MPARSVPKRRPLRHTPSEKCHSKRRRTGAAPQSAPGYEMYTPATRFRIVPEPFPGLTHPNEHIATK